MQRWDRATRLSLQQSSPLQHLQLICIKNKNMSIIEITTVGLSLVVTGIGITSQVRKNHTRRSMEGLSFFYFFILAVSYSFWVVYGIASKDWVLILPMSIGAIMSWVVVIQFFIYKKQKISSIIKQGGSYKIFFILLRQKEVDIVSLRYRPIVQ